MQCIASACILEGGVLGPGPCEGSQNATNARMLSGLRANFSDCARSSRPTEICKPTYFRLRQLGLTIWSWEECEGFRTARLSRHCVGFGPLNVESHLSNYSCSQVLRPNTIRRSDQSESGRRYPALDEEFILHSSGISICLSLKHAFCQNRWEHP